MISLLRDFDHFVAVQNHQDYFLFRLRLICTSGMKTVFTKYGAVQLK